nr:PaaX family transcriptional regulator C-terminal domain-containing protein [Sneathiella chinensis]
MLMTVWGDAIAPHGGTVWLGSLIDLAADLGLNERLVRTSVFRLKQENLLTSVQKGRRSDYTLTPSGRHRVEEATRRIYNYQPEPWDGKWVFLFSERRSMSDEQKRLLGLELGWLGFGDLGAGIYAHPGANTAAVSTLLQDLGLEPHVAILSGEGLAPPEKTPQHILVQKGWNLQQIEAGYTEFMDHFSGIGKALIAGHQPDARTCFLVRTLLVHGYRRALLRDPMLPERLLPQGWSGNRARLLFRDIYLLVWEQAEQHLLNILRTVDGDLPPASAEFHARFGGLKQAQ